LWLTFANAAAFITLALGSGRMVADSEIAISTTSMAATDAAPFLSYLRRSESLNALAVKVKLLVKSRLVVTYLDRDTEAFGQDELANPERNFLVIIKNGTIYKNTLH
jgi:hypothetical protein